MAFDRLCLPLWVWSTRAEFPTRERKPLIHMECNATFGPTLPLNMPDVLNYNFHNPLPLTKRIGVSLNRGPKYRNYPYIE